LRAAWNGAIIDGLMAKSSAPKAAPPVGSPQIQLNRFLAKYTPAMVKASKASMARLRLQVPGAVELVYDNYNALVIGFGPSERASEAILSLALMPRWVTLCFLQGGPKLPDPNGLLRGSGTTVRNVRLASPADLDTPAVRALIRTALARAKVPIDATGRRRMIIKSISAKQRPRRPS
jgi:hypothetical protein